MKILFLLLIKALKRAFDFSLSEFDPNVEQLPESKSEEYNDDSGINIDDSDSKDSDVIER